MKKIIIVSGKMRSGKDTFAGFLMEYFGKHQVKITHDYFAKELKNNVISDFCGLKKVVNGMVNDIINKHEILDDLDSLRNDIKALKWDDANYFDIKTPISRSLLQIYGTEIFRKRVNDNYWVDIVIDNINNSDDEYFVLTDARFENEIERLSDKCDNCEIIAIRIERDMDSQTEANEHPSETGLDNFKCWSYVVDNNNSLDELKKSAKLLYGEITNG